MLLLENLIGDVNLKSILVLFQGKKHKLIHQYSSGYCEIQKEEYRQDIILVHFSQLTFFSNPKLTHEKLP